MVSSGVHGGVSPQVLIRQMFWVLHNLWVDHTCWFSVCSCRPLDEEVNFGVRIVLRKRSAAMSLQMMGSNSASSGGGIEMNGAS